MLKDMMDFRILGGYPRRAAQYEVIGIARSGFCVCVVIFVVRKEEEKKRRNYYYYEIRLSSCLPSCSLVTKT